MTSIHSRLFALLACGVWLIGAAGCGGRSDRVVVSGTITYDGAPIEKGQIRFVPTNGAIVIDPIDLGHYSTADAGGVPLGSHRIEITGYDGEEYANAPTGPGAPPVRQLLPEKYNRQSELTVTIDSSSGDAPLNFELAR